MKKNIPCLLLGLYIAVFAWSAYKPTFHDVWLVEAITSAVPVLILIVLYIRKVRFSNLAYVLASVLPIMHVIGAHYTFAAVPFEP